MREIRVNLIPLWVTRARLDSLVFIYHLISIRTTLPNIFECRGLFVSPLSVSRTQMCSKYTCARLHSAGSCVSVCVSVCVGARHIVNGYMHTLVYMFMCMASINGTAVGGQHSRITTRICGVRSIHVHHDQQ